ncbi:unnamed protein product [Brachionus calyciflorus]|uniref:EGF-like domain-containing protein n=1 Tax=Brachionus calyciflorus TaxID=104777 RepID=A0A813RDG6_9BILA|nr:unnamed protein product [Brachionus calyciflorus]
MFMENILLSFILQLLKKSEAYQFITGSDDCNINIWSNSLIYKSLNSSFKIISMDIDYNRSVAIAGTNLGKIIVWNVLSDEIFINKSNDNLDVNSILILNSTTFLAGYEGRIIFWSFPNLIQIRIIENTTLGIVKDMKLFKDENLVLIGSLSKHIFVFSLEKNQIISKYYTDAQVLSVDILDKSFIVSQCDTNGFCLLSMDADHVLRSTLIEKSFNLIIYSIKIINSSCVALGTADQYFVIWQKSEKLLYLKANGDRISSINSVYFLDDKTIITGHDNGSILLWDKTLLVYKKTLKISSCCKINAIKSIININLTFTKDSTSRSQIGVFTNKNLPIVQTTSFTQGKDLNFNTKEITQQTYITSTNEIDEVTSKSYDPHSDTKNTHQISNSVSEIIYQTDISSQIIKTTIHSEKEEIFAEKYTFSSTAIISVNLKQNTNSNHEERLQTSVPKEQISISPFNSILNDFYQEESTNSSELSRSETFKFSTENNNEIETTQMSYIKTVSHFITKSFENDQDIIFSYKNIKQVLFLLELNFDLNDCLSNCSDHGLCKMNDNFKYLCECKGSFKGSRCQINTDPCSSNPCLNNGNCISNLYENTYFCECALENNHTKLYKGQNCEYKIDVCENETCSKNGICIHNNKPICKCFSMYSGEKCQDESNDLKAIKSVKTTSSVIAIIIIAFLFIGVVLNDVSNFYFKIKKNKRKLKVFYLKNLKP